MEHPARKDYPLPSDAPESMTALSSSALPSRERRGQTVIDRPRVTRRLLEAAEYPIILLTAPAGFGKTTAIKQFLARCENAIFVATPPTATTLDRFVHAFAHGCAAQIPAMSSPPTEFSDLLPSSEELELQSAWAIANLQGTTCMLAIDDLQHTDSDPRVAAFLSRLVDHCGEQLQWLFSSRTHGHLPRARWQAYAQADASITADDLRMDAEEAHQLAAALHSVVPSAQLDAWVEATHGFPIPLTYAIRSTARGGSISHTSSGMRTLTFDFLAEHLWSTLPPQDRALLELAAFLPATKIKDYERFGIDGAYRTIVALANDITFIALDAEFTFSMHDLFRDFIRQQVLLRGSEAHDGTVRQAVELLLGSNQPLQALELLVAFGDVSALLDAIEDISFPLDDLEMTPRLIAATEHERVQSICVQALAMHANYWTRRESSANALRYAEEIPMRTEARSRDLLCAIRTISKFKHFDSATTHRSWLEQIPKIIDRLDKPDRAQAIAYQANYCSRFPETTDEAKRLLNGVLQQLPSLDLNSRFEVLMVNAVTFILLEDGDSALKSGREALKVGKMLNDPTNVLKAQNSLGIMLYNRCDHEFEIISEELRHLVAVKAAWRFSQTSHWLPAEYFARCGDSKRSQEVSALIDDVIVTDDFMVQWLASCRRINRILINLIDKHYAGVLDDFRRLGLPDQIDVQWQVKSALALSHAFLGDDAAATKIIAEATDLREKIADSWHAAGVFDVYYGEVLALCAAGKWSNAKRLLIREGKAAAGLPVLYDALMLLADGPPFVGVEAAFQPHQGKPYVGIVALLASRVVEKWSAPVKERLLTAAEADILRLIDIGKSNKDIAATRSRSIETVKRQVASLYRKLGVEKRTSAVAVARERGLL